MTILVTGSAGFIGMHTTEALLNRGEQVLGVDNLNDYYDVTLKEARLARLNAHEGFEFVKLDVADRETFKNLVTSNPKIDRVIHLAAQAGVRYSLENPGAYIDTNINGQLSVLEACRHHGNIQHLVYASSSSVYGGNEKMPFSIEDRVDKPISLYAATKRSAELMSWCYSHLYRLPQTGLRFFTVYGPWGRPDMSAFLFTKAIFEGKPIRVFNNGEMRRDFTFVEDIVSGILKSLDTPPEDSGKEPPQRVFNIGNNRTEALMDFITEIEKATGGKAEINFEPMQPGDVAETYADIEATRRELGFEPKTTIREGIPKFVNWYRDFYKIV